MGTLGARWAMGWEQPRGCEEGGAGASGKAWPGPVTFIAGLISILPSICPSLRLPITTTYLFLYHYISTHSCPFITCMSLCICLSFLLACIISLSLT